VLESKKRHSHEKDLPMPPALKILLAALFFFLLSGKAEAHPHVWVMYQVKAISNSEGISKFELTWEFDNLFTSMVLEELGLKSVAAKDWKAIEEKAFSNLAKYHYYMKFKLDGADFRPSKISNFSADLKGKTLTYNFTVTLPKPAKKAELVIFDDEFYVDLGPPTQEAPDNKVGGFMSEQNFVLKPFLKAEGEGSANPPTCNYREGKQDNPMWGKITFFTVDCAAS
jgi:ABC-type uncharacterized transport system substrate-binding protein